jgi:endonuclease/exonuclease/phosphatase family metal-dependent hydrolase
MRHCLPESDTDKDATFNGFSKMLKFVNKTMKFFNLDPGATIDHIFFRSHAYRPTSFKCLRAEDKVVSDHFPVIGTF